MDQEVNQTEILLSFSVFGNCRFQTGSETPESVRRSSAQSREKYRVKDGEMNDFQQFMLNNLLMKFSQMGEFN